LDALDILRILQVAYDPEQQRSAGDLVNDLFCAVDGDLEEDLGKSFCRERARGIPEAGKCPCPPLLRGCFAQVKPDHADDDQSHGNNF
jgi:hypothetical protein